jgi:hypothetical protein
MLAKPGYGRNIKSKEFASSSHSSANRMMHKFDSTSIIIKTNEDNSLKQSSTDNMNVSPILPRAQSSSFLKVANDFENTMKPAPSSKAALSPKSSELTIVGVTNRLRQTSINVSSGKPLYFSRKTPEIDFFILFEILKRLFRF